MAAVDRLLEGLRAIDEVVDYVATNPSTLPRSVADEATRGLVVHGLSSFETFVRDRAKEWSGYLTAARIPASRLPGGIIPFSDRIVQTLPRKFRDSGDPARTALVDDLAKTLASFSSSTLVGHELFFAWSGSNVQTSDIEAMVVLVGLRGWSELTAVWSHLDPRASSSQSAQSLMVAFAELRHRAAHDASAVLDPVAVGAITRNIRTTAMILDVAVSFALSEIAAGRTPTKGFASGLLVRTIRLDSGKWAEYSPGSVGAVKRHDSLEDAIAVARGRGSASKEIVLAFDGNDLLDWRSHV